MRLFNPEVQFTKIKCKCGHILTFLSPYPATCRNCGRLVTPTTKKNFKENLMKVRKKHECNNT